jgi:hypothetical protein
VEDVDDRFLTVARPLDLPAEHDLQVGSAVMTTWWVSSGVWVLPCRLVEVRREGRVPLWDVEIVGEGRREQRRAFVRAAVTGPVSMRWSVTGQGEYRASGVIADLSEASLRLVSRDRAVADHAPVGGCIEVSLRTAGKSFELHAELLRVSPVSGLLQNDASTQWQVVLRFTDPGKAADELRRIVFGQQLRDRNGR